MVPENYQEVDMVMRKNVRTCNACGKEMDEGYCIEGGIEYYCSEVCLHKNITPAEWDELYDDGNGDSYWTDWSEDPDAFDDEDEDEDEDEVDTYHARDCSIPELTAEVERLKAENERMREMLSRTESALDVLAQTICDVEEIVGVELTVRAEAATKLAMDVRAALRQEV